MDNFPQRDDRIKHLQAFDDTKSGVKGLVDAAAGKPVEIPSIFIRPPHEIAQDLKLPRTSLRIPAIDLKEAREKVVEEVRRASEKWGFFQVVNHGIGREVLEDILGAVREFNEQDVEKKKEYYSRDPERKVKFNTNFDFYMSSAANWRDTMIIDMMNSYGFDPRDLPSVCRDATMNYINNLKKVVDTLFELLSEALGLETNHLKLLECDKSQTFAFHYYPPCPMPEQTLGISKHTDASFLTILLEDQLGGLQVLHEDLWVDVEPIHGSLIVNIGDLLQILSNDKFKSVIHRALGNATRTRTSVACFLQGVYEPLKIYGPIKELITEESLPVFKEFTVNDYMMKFYSRGIDEKSGLNYVRL